VSGGHPPVLNGTASRGWLAVYASRLLYEFAQVRGHASRPWGAGQIFTRFVGSYKYERPA